MTNYETIIIGIDKRGVATLTLNRPEKHNALNAKMISELRHAAFALGENNDVRLVILTGAGKSFCAGGDLNWFAGNIDRTRGERIHESGELARMLRDLNTLPKPLIGAINGPAYGGGVGMISVCDITVGLNQSLFGLTEVRLGLPPANISPYVVDRIGKSNARATMLSGALFSGERAKEIGLLTFLANDQEKQKSMLEVIITDHLEAAPEAVAATKELINFVASHSIEENMTYTAECLADAWETDEGQLGVSSFLNKKLPPWRSK